MSLGPPGPAGPAGPPGDTTKIDANTVTNDYVLVAGDAGKVIEMNAGAAKKVTVPTNAAVGFPIGTVIDLMRLGAGTFEVQVSGGVTLRSPGGLVFLAQQYSQASLRKRAADEWVLSGDLA